MSDINNSNVSDDPDAVGRVKIFITVSFATVLAALGITATIFFANEEDAQRREVYSFGMLALTAVATGASAFYLLQSIRSNTRASEKGIQHTIALNKDKNKALAITNALGYIARWNSIQNMEASRIGMEVHSRVNGQSPTEQGRIIEEYIDEDPSRKTSIVYILNFLEELAVALKTSSVDDDVCKSFFRGIVTEYYKIFYVFIAKRRNEKNNDRLYQNLSELAATWKNGNGNGNGTH